MEALTWGAEDLSAAIGAQATRDADGRLTDVFRLARAMTLLAASAADVPAIDTVFPDFRDLDAFRRSCVEAERDGFAGCMAIHPAQVPSSTRSSRPRPSHRRGAKASSRPSRRREIPASWRSTARCSTGRICGGPSACSGVPGLEAPAREAESPSIASGPDHLECLGDEAYSR
jgi:hypothetical protein